VKEGNKMKFLKAITTEGKTEYFNVNQILAITPRKSGDVTILMGAGLYWHVKPETMAFVELENLVNEVKNK
jgi:hypothetical protein